MAKRPKGKAKPKVPVTISVPEEERSDSEVQSPLHLKVKTFASARIYIFNFFLYSSIGSLLPFLPIFFNLIGFSSLQNGILCAVRPLVSIWFGPLMTALATNTRFKKFILFFLLASGVAATFSLCLIHMNTEGLLKTNECAKIKSGHLPDDVSKNLHMLNNQSINTHKILTTLMTFTVETNNTFGNNIYPMAVDNIHGNIKDHQNQELGIFENTDFSDQNFQRRDVSQLFTIAHHTLNGSFNIPETHTNNSFANSMKIWKKYLVKTSKVLYHRISNGILKKDYFISILLLTFISESFISPLLHFVQAAIQSDKRQSLSVKFCMTRIFSRVALAVSAFTSCYVAWKYNCSYIKANSFYFHFYAFLGIGAITTFLTVILPADHGVPQEIKFCQNSCKGLNLVFSHLKVCIFVLTLWITGIAHGTINAYLPWYAVVNGANELAVGFLITVAIATDTMLFSFVGYSIRWFGYAGLLSIGLICISCQLFLLTFINNPWYLIPTQILNGISSATVKAALVDYAQSISKLGMERFICFVFQSAYVGFGMGIGGLVISVLYFVYGSEKTFVGVAIFTLSYAVIYGIVVYLFFRGENHDLNTSLYQKVNDNEDDWLVTALADDSDQTISSKKKSKKNIEDL